MPSRNSSQPSAVSAQPPLFPSASSAKSADHSPRRKFAASWSADARRFAGRCLDHWNVAFRGHGVRANQVRRNFFAAIQLYRWLCSPDNAGSASLQACAPMTEDDVFTAIGLYASDPHNAKHCNGRYQDFHSWMSGCPDNIDKQLARVGRHRGAKPADPRAAAAKAFADELLTTLGLGDAARRATTARQDLRDWIADQTRQLPITPRLDLLGRDRDAADRAWLKTMSELFRRFDALPEADRNRFEARANKGISALRGPKCPPLESANLRAALALALFHKEQAGSGQQPTAKS